MSTPQLPRWQSQEIAAARISVDFFSGVATTEGDFGAHFIAQSHEVVNLSVWVGRDLAGWRGLLARPRITTLGPEEAITVCGQPATRQEAIFVDEGATGVSVTPGGKLEHMYARARKTIQVAVAFSHVGQPVTLVWSIEEAQRDFYRAAEQHFFQAVRCH